jgi:hypothetical protein
VASAARGDFAGAALHGAAAIKFAAGARSPGSEAGGGSGGGSAGGGGGAGGGTTFQPREASGGGGQTIVLQTVNPYSREVIGEAIYQIDRAGSSSGRSRSRRRPGLVGGGLMPPQTPLLLVDNVFDTVNQYPTGRS